jgi:hypothetical protein
VCLSPSSETDAQLLFADANPTKLCAMELNGEISLEVASFVFFRFFQLK